MNKIIGKKAHEKEKMFPINKKDVTFATQKDLDKIRCKAYKFYCDVAKW